MIVGTGIALAVIAMLSWGIGDFLIQKSTRKLGDWETLFVITAFGTLVLLPFVYKDIPSLFQGNMTGLIILLSSAVLLATAALMHMESFKRGKISVLEPLMSIELISATFLSFFILGDKIHSDQGVIIVTLVLGLFLLSFRGKILSVRYFIEKGVFLFILGSFLMGGADFFLGWGSRVTNPVLANFILNVVMMTISGVAVIAMGRAGTLIRDVRKHPALVLVMSITDNIAWLAYAFAMSLIPIAIATGLSESSTIIAVFLGLFVSKEKLQTHQRVGLTVAIVSAITLALISS